MPRFISAWLVIAFCALGNTPLRAQAFGEKEDAGKAGARPFGAPAAAGAAVVVHPLMQALDTDRDGMLSAKEIRAAVRELKKLDTNRDGKLTPDELVPAAPMGAVGAGGDAGAAGRAAGGAGGRGGVGGAGGLGAGPAGGVGGGFANPGGIGAAGLGGAGLGGAGQGGRGGAMSQPPGAGLPVSASRMMAFDKNRDGRVSREELPDQLWAIVGRFDANRDGALDPLELRTAGRSGR